MGEKIKAIRIHHMDDAAQALDRHQRIEARLKELGAEEVRFLQGNGKLPTQWDPIIAAWLRGEEVEKSEAA